MVRDDVWGEKEKRRETEKKNMHRTVGRDGGRSKRRRKPLNMINLIDSI